jgi:hypothetical protein
MVVVGIGCGKSPSGSSSSGGPSSVSTTTATTSTTATNTSGTTSGTTANTSTTSTNANTSGTSGTNSLGTSGTSTTTGTVTTNTSNTGTSGTTSTVGTTGTTGTSGTSGTLDQFCNDFSDAFCSLAARCQAYALPSSCQQELSQECLAEYQPPVSSGRQTLTNLSNYEQVCSAQGTAQLPCENDLDVFLLLICGIGVTQPNVPLGSACDTQQDCDRLPDGGSVYCVAPPQTCGGVCEYGASLGENCGESSPDYLSCIKGFCPYGEILSDGGPAETVCTAYAEQGQPCDGTQTQCDPTTSYCYFTASGGFCVRQLGPGAGCPGDGCQANYYCGNPDGGFQDQTCQPQSAVGQPCDPNLFGACVGGATCASIGLCAPYDSNPGEPCDVSVTYCNSNSACQGEGATSLGTCVAVDAGLSPGLGSSCSGSNDDEASCGAGLFGAEYRCVNGTCVALPGDGQPCSALGHCIRGDNCVNGTCHQFGQVGQSCSPIPGTTVCWFGYCDETTNVCSNFKSPGAACDPLNFECSGSTHCTGFADGGELCSDKSCVSIDGGAPVCIAPCY